MLPTNMFVPAGELPLRASSPKRVSAQERAPASQHVPEPRPVLLDPARKRMRAYLDDAVALTTHMGNVFETVEMQATEIERLKKRLKGANTQVQETRAENDVLLRRLAALVAQLAEARGAIPAPEAVSDQAIPPPTATQAELQATLTRLQRAAELFED